MKQKMSVNWDGGMAFSSQINGHAIAIDAPEEFGGSGSAPNPKPLMLMALAGCTGIDVVSILKKMKVKIETFSIDVESTMTEDHPKVYTAMHIFYSFAGKNLDAKKIQRAIELSMNNYCGVSAMYKRAMDITYEMKITES
ncbi:MAG: OsmC family protein [Desulfobulbaceae bacterium]|nr:OsmC family protein [Desulfobulbaceae bacterium]